MKVNMRLAAIAMIAGLSAIPLLAQSSGKAIYTRNCAVCHGLDGKANTPVGHPMKAQDLDVPASVKAPDAQFIAAVKKGKGKMPEFGTKLSNAQIKAVITYVRSLQRK